MIHGDQYRRVDFSCGENAMTEKELTDKPNNLATSLEILLNQCKTWAYEIKADSNAVEVVFDWDYCYGWFIVTPSRDGGYTVEDEYYMEKFDTIQQVADYLVKKDNDNAR